MEVYSNPKYYEIAFSFRDIPAEVDFIERVIAKESRIPVKRFLEIASGNSPHMKELCKRGYCYIGLEMSDEMIAYSRKTIEDGALSAEIIKGDMIDFSLPTQADCALLFLGSFYVTSDEELRSHLDSVACALKSGGLYILDNAVIFFPEDAMNIQSWDMEADGVKVTTTYAPAWVDEKERISDAKITLDIEEGGKKRKIEHVERRKLYMADDFIRIAESTGKWERAGAFSNFDMSKEPYPGGRNIVVLRRK
ncbi:MAG: class I SAM-dependent methyltransferase [Patescibacteria group bacterium]|nr:class I SAM-dependent methyltransferase [Patescibacteria group bacterium]